jgi:hypothetical protein
LNDLGSCARVDSSELFLGALHHAPDDVIEKFASGRKYQTAGAHDLVMLVWTAFELAFPMFWCDVHMGDDEPDRGAFHIIRTRRAFLPEGSLWHKFLKLASSGDYDGVAKAFLNDLPLLYPVIDSSKMNAKFARLHADGSNREHPWDLCWPCDISTA